MTQMISVCDKLPVSDVESRFLQMKAPNGSPLNRRHFIATMITSTFALCARAADNRPPRLLLRSSMEGKVRFANVLMARVFWLMLFLIPFAMRTSADDREKLTALFTQASPGGTVIIPPVTTCSMASNPSLWYPG